MYSAHLSFFRDFLPFLCALYTRNYGISMYGALTFGGYLHIPVSQWHYLWGSPVKWCIVMWLRDRMWCHSNQHTQICPVEQISYVVCSPVKFTCAYLYPMVLPHLCKGALWCDFMIGCDATITSTCRCVQWSRYYHTMCVYLWSLPVHTCTTMAYYLRPMIITWEWCTDLLLIQHLCCYGNHRITDVFSGTDISIYSVGTCVIYLCILA